MSRRLNVLALATDAYGGVGGIELYNRDIFRAFSEHPEIKQTIVVPRIQTSVPAEFPPRVAQCDEALRSPLTFIKTALSEARRLRPALIHCAHINLAPVAAFASKLTGSPWVMSTYGKEAWRPHHSRATRMAASRAKLFLPISQTTETRFRRAYPEARAASALLPNALHLDQLVPGPRSLELLSRYGLADNRIVLTIARIAADFELKGFARMIAVLPELLKRDPSIRYIIGGDGPYREKLKDLVAERGLTDKVVFTGLIAEAEKADHFRMADAFVMPSTGEGFGFVFTEAMACGIPVVASRTDGGIDALRGGVLGRAVDPMNPAELIEATMAALDTPKHVPEGLDYFAFPKFCERLYAAIDPFLRQGLARR